MREPWQDGVYVRLTIMGPVFRERANGIIARLVEPWRGTMLKVASLSFASLAALALASGDARAEGETCSRGGDVRVIEILAPGAVGAACDVRVTRDGGAQVNTPYHANVDRNFCRAMAAELASKLTADGFSCRTAASADLEAALAGAEAPTPPAESALTELSLDQQADQLGLATAPAGAPAPAIEPEPAAAPALAMAPIANPEPELAPRAAPAPKPAPAADAAPSLEGIVDLDEPASAPIVLTEGAQPAATRAPRPNRNGAGRLVGVQPSLGETAAPVLASAGALPQRSPEDIVKGVIAASAAAWNEGNLTAFLNGYEQSSSVRLVSGGDVVTGIAALRKHYQAQVQASGAMGRLSFSDLDVSLTAPEVATVLGRYAHDAGLAKTAGAVTLVMKQVDGRWRIVQETRVKDADVPTLAPVN